MKKKKKKNVLTTSLCKKTKQETAKNIQTIFLTWRGGQMQSADGHGKKWQENNLLLIMFDRNWRVGKESNTWSPCHRTACLPNWMTKYVTCLCLRRWHTGAFLGLVVLLDIGHFFQCYKFSSTTLIARKIWTFRPQESVFLLPIFGWCLSLVIHKHVLLFFCFK